MNRRDFLRGLAAVAVAGAAPGCERERRRGDAVAPGTAYAAWYDDHRRLVRTALGPVAAPTARSASRGAVSPASGAG